MGKAGVNRCLKRIAIHECDHQNLVRIGIAYNCSKQAVAIKLGLELEREICRLTHLACD